VASCHCTTATQSGGKIQINSTFYYKTSNYEDNKISKNLIELVDG
jgi:hypothetical protein